MRTGLDKIYLNKLKTTSNKLTSHEYPNNRYSIWTWDTSYATLIILRLSTVYITLTGLEEQYVSLVGS